MIDEMLDRGAPFGEVTLRVKDGKLKFVAQSKSYDALKLQRPNALEEELNNDKSTSNTSGGTIFELLTKFQLEDSLAI